MIKRILFFLAISCTFLFAACKPTPVSPVIINKNDGRLEEIIQSTQSPDVKPKEQHLHVETWKEVYTIPTLVCHIEPEIVLPAQKIFPVLKMQQSAFTGDLANQLLSHFAKDAVLSRPNTLSREDLLEELAAVKRGIYVLDDSGGRWEAYDGQKDDIKRLEEEIKNTQEEHFNPTANASIPFPFDQIYVMEDNTRRYIWANEDMFVYSALSGTIQPEAWVLAGYAIPDEPRGTSIDNIQIGKEKATNMALELLNALGIDDFGIASITKARIVGEYAAGVVSEGWLLLLSGSYGDYIPVEFSQYQLGGLFRFENEEYAKSWEAESIQIYVDENGIQNFAWRNRMEVVSEVHTNVPILDFEEIKLQIKNNIRYGYAWMDTNEVVSDIEIKVHKIILTGIMIPVKDDLDSHYLVPAWIVFYHFLDAPQNSTSIYVFAVNAIDGSNIDLIARTVQ